MSLPAKIRDRAEELLAENPQLDYRVVEAPINTDFGTVDGHKALFGVKGGKVVSEKPFQICTDRYTTFDNFSLAVLAAGLEEKSCGEMQVVEAGSLAHGMVHFTLESRDDYDVARGDICKMRFNLLNSHTSQTALLGFSSGHRLVCSNQLPAVYEKGFSEGFRLKHRSDHETLMSVADESLTLYSERVEHTLGWARELAGKSVTPSLVNPFFELVYEKRFRLKEDASEKEESRYEEKMMKSVSTMINIYEDEARDYGTTQWVAINAATKWLQHHAGRMTSQRRSLSNLSGRNSDRTREAFLLAQEMFSAA